jgi:hypothetical protein
MLREDPEAYTKKRLGALCTLSPTYFSTHSEGIEYLLSQVKSNSEGQGSRTTTLRETSVDKLFSAEPVHVNVEEAGSGNPPRMSCANLKESG